VDNIPSESQSRGRRSRVAWALGFMLLAVSIFAAWQAHELWFSREAGPRRADRPARGEPPAPRRQGAKTARPAPRLPAASQSQPATNLADPFAELDVAPVEDGLAEFPAAPPAARGLKAFRMPDGAIVARYTWRGEVDRAADHYRRAMADEGWMLLDDSAGADAWRTLKFDSKGKRAIVALRASLADATIVEIEVTVIAAK
jgi:hypothetical protein